MKRKYRLLPCSALLIAFCSFGAWRIYPDVHQRWLDNQLFAAIYRDDIYAATSLLEQGANANVQGDPSMPGLSFRHFLIRYLRRGSQAQRVSSALDAAMNVQIPYPGTATYSASSSPDINMVLLLLAHNAVFHPKPGYYVRVYKGWFHHGDQSAYVDIEACPEGSDYGEESISTTFIGTESQLDLLVHATLQAGGRLN